MSAAIAEVRPRSAQEPIQQLFSLAVPLDLSLTDTEADLAHAAQHLSEQTRILKLVEASADQMAAASAGNAERLLSVSEVTAGASKILSQAARGTLATVSQAQTYATDLAMTANDIDVQAMAAEGQVNDLRRASDGIQKIAREIQMLAVNAGVEAARHGAAGRGFAVIAEAIKGLADQTRLATDAMGKHLTGLGATVSSLQHSCKSNLDHARRMDDATSEAALQSAGLGEAQSAVAEVTARLGQAVSSVEQLANTSKEMGTRMHEGVSQIAQASERITASSERLGDILKLSESITSCLMEMDASLPTSSLADMCQATAHQIGELLEASVKAGEISCEDLFDEQYRPIEGTRPEQFLTRFTGLTDRLLPDVQERLLGSDPRIAFCAAVDRNGYLPTHNRKFSQPQSQDVVWNAQHCRNRRIFNDRAGLSAARNRNPVLLQSYRRDMGGGRFMIMNELASPIMVEGRHWGAFRIGFQLQGGQHGRMG